MPACRVKKTKRISPTYVREIELDVHTNATNSRSGSSLQNGNHNAHRTPKHNAAKTTQEVPETPSSKRGYR